MPSRSWRFRIDDIVEAINKIERYTYFRIVINRSSAKKILTSWSSFVISTSTH